MVEKALNPAIIKLTLVIKGVTLGIEKRYDLEILKNTI
jgi:hypothetical protein